MTVKTSELTGAALDWAVAKCEEMQHLDNAESWLRDYRIGFSTRYSSTWSQGGPIIDKMRGIKLKIGRKPSTPCYAHIVGYNGVEQWHQTGKTPLIAAMRCYVASKLGDTVEIPDELML